MKRSLSLAIITLMLVGAALCAPPAWSQDDSVSASAARERVNRVTHVVEQMRRNADLSRLLKHAKGVFIIPQYRERGAVLGGESGGGVVLVRRHGAWSDPAFYNIGGASVGSQVGGERGAVAMLLMTHKAVERFENANYGWSLNAKSGLTVADYSSAAARHSDVIFWSSARGLYAELTAGFTDISPDEGLDRAYYRRPADSRAILHGHMSDSHSADALREALAIRVATR